MARGNLKSALKRYQQTNAISKAQEQRQNHALNMRSAQKAAQAAKTRSAQLRNPKPPWHPFTNEQSTILLIGEGDFSFALAFSKRFAHSQILATSLDSETDVQAKYPHTITEIFPELSNNGVDILHQIDATKLNKSKHLKQLSKPLTIVFNFPHLGNSISDQDRNIRQHQELIMTFFQQCRELGATDVVLTVFCGEPYDSWQFKQFAKQSGYKINRSGTFNWAEWPEYNHQLTSKIGETHKQQKMREARMYHWSLSTEDSNH